MTPEEEKAAERALTNVFDPTGYIGDRRLSDLFTTPGLDVCGEVLSDARTLAAGLKRLAAVKGSPADDAEPVTAERAVALGGEDRGPIVFTGEYGVVLKHWPGDGGAVCAETRIESADGSVLVVSPKTMGDLRRLCAAIGHPIPGVPQPGRAAT